MVKAVKTVKTIDSAVKAYGGVRKFEAAFRLRDTSCWHVAGVPRAHALGLYLGLKARGYEPTPRLFGLKSWEEIEGV